MKCAQYSNLQPQLVFGFAAWRLLKLSPISPGASLLQTASIMISKGTLIVSSPLRCNNVCVITQGENMGKGGKAALGYKSPSPLPVSSNSAWDGVADLFRELSWVLLFCTATQLLCEGCRRNNKERDFALHYSHPNSLQ